MGMLAAGIAGLSIYRIQRVAQFEQSFLTQLLLMRISVVDQSSFDDSVLELTPETVKAGAFPVQSYLAIIGIYS